PSKDEVTKLRDLLGNIAVFSVIKQNEKKANNEQTPFVTRTDLNKAYVWEEGSTATNFKFKKSNPFALLLKQMVDLKYNVNLPDALNRYSFTSNDSLPRSFLQEIKILSEKRAPLDLREICQTLASQAISLASADMDIPEDVSFTDIAAL